MSDDKNILFLKNVNPLSKYEQFTESELFTNIKYYEHGEEKLLRPIELEYLEVWNDEGCQIILIELFFESLDHTELLQKYRNRMYQLQQSRANEYAKSGGNPDQLINSEEFTKFNVQNAELFLYRSLNKLQSLQLVKKVALTVNSLNIYYSLTHEGKEKIITWLGNKHKSSDFILLFLLRHYNETTKISIKKKEYKDCAIQLLYIFMYMMKQLTSIDPILLCLTMYNTIQDLYNVYLSYLSIYENKSTLELQSNPKYNVKMILQKLNSLIKYDFIASDQTNKTIVLTEQGKNQVNELLSFFQNKILSLKNDYLIDINSESNNILLSSIYFTNNGKLIAEQFQSSFSHDDEKMIMNMVDMTKEGIIPLQDEIERLKIIKIKNNKAILRVTSNKYSAFDYILSILTSYYFLIAAFLFGITGFIYSIITEFANITFFVFSVFCMFSLFFIKFPNRS